MRDNNDYEKNAGQKFEMRGFSRNTGNSVALRGAHFPAILQFSPRFWGTGALHNYPHITWSSPTTNPRKILRDFIIFLNNFNLKYNQSYFTIRPKIFTSSNFIDVVRLI